MGCQAATLPGEGQSAGLVETAQGQTSGDFKTSGAFLSCRPNTIQVIDQIFHFPTRCLTFIERKLVVCFHVQISQTKLTPPEGRINCLFSMNTKLHIISFFFQLSTLEKTFCYCFEKHIFHLRNALFKAPPLAFLTGSQSAVRKSVISAVSLIWLWLHDPTFRATSPLNSGSLSINILKPIYKGHYQDSGALDPMCVLGASCVWH